MITLVIASSAAALTSGIVAGTTALAGTIANRIATRKQNERAKREQIQAEKRQRFLRQQEDADRVQSLKNAGLNPNIAYSGPASTVATSASPVSKDESYDTLLQGSQNAVSDVLLAQQTESNVALQSSQSALQDATAKKTKEEAENLRLLNEQLRGKNQGAYFHLQKLGFSENDVKPERALGFFTQLDFADEYVTKKDERLLRSVASRLDSMLKQSLMTDNDYLEKSKRAILTNLDKMLTDFDIAKADLRLKNQEISFYKYKKQDWINRNQKASFDNEKMALDMDALRANTQIAKENSYLNIFKNIADAHRRADVENEVYWTMIFNIKNGTFDSFEKSVLTSAGSVPILSELEKVINEEMIPRREPELIPNSKHLDFSDSIPRKDKYDRYYPK